MFRRLMDGCVNSHAAHARYGVGTYKKHEIAIRLTAPLCICGTRGAQGILLVCAVSTGPSSTLQHLGVTNRVRWD